jgi:hypothetical protein
MAEWFNNRSTLHTFIYLNVKITTLSNGYLGSRNDEERSEMRYVMRIAEFSESSNLWTQIALLGSPRSTPLSVSVQQPLSSVSSFYRVGWIMRVWVRPRFSLLKYIEWVSSHAYASVRDFRVSRKPSLWLVVHSSEWREYWPFAVSHLRVTLALSCDNL